MLTEHRCFVYDNDEALAANARAFLDGGRRRGQRALLVGPGSADDLRNTFLGRDTGELAIHSLADAYGSDYTVDSEPTLAAFQAELDQALAAGHTGLCVVAILTEAARTAERLAALARWEHLVGRWQSEQPISSICAYDRGALGEPTVAELACLHPTVDGPPAVQPFRLFFRDGRLTLAGEIDAFSVPLLTRALAHVQVERGDHIIIDARELRFIEHRGLFGIVDALSHPNGARVTLQAAGAAAARLRDILPLNGAELEVHA